MNAAGSEPRRRLRAAVAAVDGHPRHVAAASLAAGLALCETTEPLFSLAGAAVAAVLLMLGVRMHVAALMLAVFLLAGSAGQLRLQSIDADPLAVAAASRVTLTGHVVEHPRERISGGATLRMRADLPGGERQLVEVSSYESPPPLSIGDGVSVTGRLSAIDPRVGSAEARSYARFLVRAGVRRRLRATAIEANGERRGGAYGVVDAIRRRSERVLATGLPAEPAALLRGMVLGGDAGIPEDTAEAFRAAGLSHILAVSGQNVLLLVILVQAIASAVGAGRLPRLVVPVALICVYVPLCGAQASVVRAGAMGLAGLAAMLASRPASRAYALLLGAIAVLAWNPRATADVGAQLSFAAVLGILAFARPLSARLKRWPAWAAEGFAVTAGATIATTPLMAHHFGTFSVISLAANVVGGPLIGPIVWLGSLAAAVGQVWPPAGALLNAPNGFLLGSLITLAHAAAAVPGAQVELSGFSGAMLAATAAPIVFAGLAVNGLMPRPRPCVPRAGAIPLLAIGVAMAAIAWVVTPSPIRIERPAIVFLDVGQGDATLLLGADGCAALIDGGPPGREIVRRLGRLGVDRLDLVIATHPQLDHDGGLGEIAAAGRPRVSAFLDGGGATTEPRFAQLRRRLDATGARSAPAVAGRHWSCGDLSVELLGPEPQLPGAPPPSDPNTRSAVAVARAGPITMLASGDAESPQLLPLPLTGVDVLKVSHHGSRDEALPAMLARARPALAVIEVGSDNRYGHPAPETLGALAGAGVEVLRTDRDGTVAVCARPGGDPVARTRVE